MRTGQCECGDVKYRSAGPWRHIIACHCRQCRRLSGHHWAATAVPAEALDITEDAGLVWRRSSEFAQRGFCSSCGSSLFYRPDGKDYIAIGAGTLDDTKGLQFVEEVFTGDKGDYYGLLPDTIHSGDWSKAWGDTEQS